MHTHYSEGYKRHLLVLTRKKGEPLEKCPFCGGRHTHGSFDSHRIGHCGSDAKKSVIVNGIEVFREDGYYIQTI